MEWYIGTKWEMKTKGICKEVIDISFTKLQKAHEVADVVIVVETIENLNDRQSKYLSSDKLGQEQLLQLGTALTPIDCYLELLIRQMVVGEKARCTINTRSGSDIVIVLTLTKILCSREIFKLTVKESYELALRYKENGVTMFKEFPLFAADYFARAAKCLLSYKPFDNLTTQDGIPGSDMYALLILIQTNLAACVLMQKRFEDVLHLTAFVELQMEPSEKGVYRRAMAYFNIKEYEKAQHTIERIHNYKEKKEFVKLQQRITDCWKISNDQYKSIVQKMFT